jgi:tape measure domain-containing protein
VADSEIKELITKLTLQNDQFKKEIKKTTDAVDGLDKKQKKTNKTFKTGSDIFKKFGALLGGAVLVKGIKNVLGLAGAFEQTRVSFETFLGSAEKADKVLKELEAFSIVTPFTIDQVNQAGKALLAFGVAAEDLEPSLKSIGDLSAGTGKDFNELAVIFGKAKVQGTLFAEDINQLTEAGIPIIDEFARLLGVSTSEVKKLGSQGKIDFPLLEQAFGDLTKEGGRFFNLMEKQSKTFEGRVSTLKGELSLLGRGIGEGILPIAGKFVEIFIKAAKGFQALPATFKNVIVGLGGLATAFVILNASLGPVGLILGAIAAAGVAVFAALGDQAEATLTLATANNRLLEIKQKILKLDEKLKNPGRSARSLQTAKRELEAEEKKLNAFIKTEKVKAATEEKARKRRIAADQAAADEKARERDRLNALKALGAQTDKLIAQDERRSTTTIDTIDAILEKERELLAAKKITEAELIELRRIRHDQEVELTQKEITNV